MMARTGPIPISIDITGLDEYKAMVAVARRLIAGWEARIDHEPARWEWVSSLTFASPEPMSDSEKDAVRWLMLGDYARNTTAPEATGKAGVPIPQPGTRICACGAPVTDDIHAP